MSWNTGAKSFLNDYAFIAKEIQYSFYIKPHLKDNTKARKGAPQLYFYVLRGTPDEADNSAG